MKDTIIINIIAGPGAGKTTVASDLFARLKRLDLDVENVFEFAKELIWQERNNAFNDRVYMHAMQNHRLFLMNGKLDYIVCDSPLLLTSIYNRFYLEELHSESYNQMIDEMVRETWNLYHNVTYYIRRSTDYQTVGRRENNLEAIQIDQKILQYLEENHIEYKTIDLDGAVETIYQDILDGRGK